MLARQAYFDNVAMFSLRGSILLMSIGTRNMVRYANFIKERMKFFILSSPVSLHSYNFTIKESLNQFLKFMELFKHLRLILKKIDPGELAIIINKANIIFLSIDRTRSRTPDIRKYKFQRMVRNT